MNKPVGWRGEPIKHGLASQGIKTKTTGLLEQKETFTHIQKIVDDYYKNVVSKMNGDAPCFISSYNIGMYLYNKGYDVIGVYSMVEYNNDILPHFWLELHHENEVYTIDPSMPDLENRIKPKRTFMKCGYYADKEQEDYFTFPKEMIETIDSFHWSDDPRKDKYEVVIT